MKKIILAILMVAPLSIMAQSKQVELQTWKKRSRMRKLLEKVLRIFAIWM